MTGKKYYYVAGNAISRKIAEGKAKKQAEAIGASKGRALRKRR